MAKIYDDAPGEVESLLASLLSDKADLQELLAYEVSVKVLMVKDADEDNPQPVLQHGGYPALAVVKINNAAARRQGLADATIIIDDYTWGELSEEQQAAALHHELYHLMVTFDGDGNLQRDDMGRPKLKMRKHDFQIGGFHAIAKQHGMNAIEVQAVVEVEKVWKQAEFAFTGG